MNKQASKVSIMIGIFIVLLVFGYISYWSTVGLFNEEVFVPTKKIGVNYMVYTGGPKFLLCISGLAVAMPALLMIIVAGYVKIKKIKIGTNKYSDRAARGMLWLLFFGLFGFVLSNVWQYVNGMVYV